MGKTVEGGLLHDLLPAKPSGRVLKPAEAQAWQSGFGFLETAKREASQLRERGRHGYASEYAQGYQDGKAAGEAEAARLIYDTVAKVDGYLEGIENEVVGLAFDVVRRVLGDLDIKQRVIQAAKQAVADIRRAKFIRITVHPNSVADVESELAALVDEETLGCAVEVDGDSSLAAHACIVATDLSVFDASIEAQLEALAKVVGAEGEGRP
ncbi:type III secretion system stator protein SctL [uncultured Nitratireductor sp.]|uniref:type III secretion system stator protein SctL n=1 Tax=uncultured Nitratireductor sp. TaxID=520953 RepID=UPI0025EF20CC|nr:type III secretion system stator protein SctL [uncultured Nitratireductor sp.]